MLVVDCSVAVKWFLEEPGDKEALAVLRSGERLVAPDLIVAEIVKVLWKRVTAGVIEPAQAADVPQAIPRTLAELWPLAPLAARTFAIAAELRHPAYDCFYLALAEARDATLVTADRRFADRLAGTQWAARATTLWG
jgi:predicted nucleic acid-binding protein